jgi:hypothetical protein
LTGLCKKVKFKKVKFEDFGFLTFKK